MPGPESYIYTIKNYFEDVFHSPEGTSFELWNNWKNMMYGNLYKNSSGNLLVMDMCVWLYFKGNF